MDSYSLVNKLEKERHVVAKKKFSEDKKQMNEKKRNALESIHNFYKTQIQILKEKLSQQKFEKTSAQAQQNKVDIIYYYYIRNYN